MNLIVENAPLFWIGLKATLGLAAVTLLASTVIGIFFGTLATLKSKPLRSIVAVYVETFRDIPLIVTIFTIFFGAPFLGVPLQPFPAVALGLALWGGANGAEIVSRSRAASSATCSTRAFRAAGAGRFTGVSPRRSSRVTPNDWIGCTRGFCTITRRATLQKRQSSTGSLRR